MSKKLEEDQSNEMSKTLLPGSTIGILGGGQLGRMISLAGTAMGYRFVTLDPTPQSPSSDVAQQIVAEYDDVNAARKLAHASDVITYEFENVDAGVAEILVKESYVPQGSELLYTTQHRVREKRAIEAAGVPVAPYRVIEGIDSLRQAIEDLGYPSVLKTATGGYDGKGQFVIRSEDQLEGAYNELAASGRELVLEKFIAFQCEISIIVARSPNGEVKSFPISENIHINNILHLSVVPARITAQVQNEARRLAEAVATNMGVVGLLAVELFVTEDGTLYVNELAPRPHNSGHYTMEACMTSQFEQLIRAVCNLPLGDTTLVSPVVMVNVLGQHLESVVQRVGVQDEVAMELGVIPKLHLYGKTESKTNRKMGHINLLCKDVQDGLEWVEQTKIWRH
ncbi:5-(carboxyamino)imidazole ribonucleotide synthase [Paenibacillus sp. FA6]|uniref:5-(carboxyamino)imidazole ribonucleotide synthase n=1 Tax=Paenibacillus sp. FA6 TaxID=3413029 RepID=UPI003F6596AE